MEFARKRNEFQNDHFIVELLLNNEYRKKPGVLQVLKGLKCPCTENGSAESQDGCPCREGGVFKLLADLEVSIKAFFSKETIENAFAAEIENEDSIPDWDRSAIIVKQYDVVFKPHQDSSKCEFQLQILRFSLLDIREGFSSKFTIIDCHQVPAVKAKLNSSWSSWRNRSGLDVTDCTSDTLHSIPLTQLLEQMGLPDSQQVSSHTTEKRKRRRPLPQSLSSCFHIKDFIISAENQNILDSLEEWKPGYRPAPSQALEEEKETGAQVKDGGASLPSSELPKVARSDQIPQAEDHQPQSSKSVCQDLELEESSNKDARKTQKSLRKKITMTDLSSSDTAASRAGARNTLDESFKQSSDNIEKSEASIPPSQLQNEVTTSDKDVRIIIRKSSRKRPRMNDSSSSDTTAKRVRTRNSLGETVNDSSDCREQSATKRSSDRLLKEVIVISSSEDSNDKNHSEIEKSVSAKDSVHVSDRSPDSQSGNKDDSQAINNQINSTSSEEHSKNEGQRGTEMNVSITKSQVKETKCKDKLSSGICNSEPRNDPMSSNSHIENTDSVKPSNYHQPGERESDENSVFQVKETGESSAVVQMKSPDIMSSEDESGDLGPRVSTQLPPVGSAKKPVLFDEWLSPQLNTQISRIEVIVDVHKPYSEERVVKDSAPVTKPPSDRESHELFLPDSTSYAKRKLTYTDESTHSNPRSDLPTHPETQPFSVSDSAETCQGEKNPTANSSLRKRKAHKNEKISKINFSGSAGHSEQVSAGDIEIDDNLCVRKDGPRDEIIVIDSSQNSTSEEQTHEIRDSSDWLKTVKSSKRNNDESETESPAKHHNSITVPHSRQNRKTNEKKAVQAPKTIIGPNSSNAQQVSNSSAVVSSGSSSGRSGRLSIETPMNSLPSHQPRRNDMENSSYLATSNKSRDSSSISKDSSESSLNIDLASENTAMAKLKETIAALEKAPNDFGATLMKIRAPDNLMIKLKDYFLNPKFAYSKS